MGLWLNLSEVEGLLRTRFLGRNLIYYTSLGSTQDVARQEAERGVPEGTVVLAEEQTAGRGHFGRPWLSPPGENLYLTLLLRPAAHQMRPLSVIAPLTIAQAVEETTGLSPRIKWPNDVLIGGRKLAGVLIESEFVGDQVRYVLVGVGVNVNLDVAAHPEIAALATSIKRELGEEASRERLLAAYLNRFEEMYQGLPQEAMSQWRMRLETLGQEVRVSFGDQIEEGVAEDVDAEGNLVLRRADGSRVTLVAGEVTLRR